MRLLTVGFLSMMAATAAVNVSDSFAADASRVDVIGTLNETVAQLDSARTTDGQLMRVDVIDQLNFEGPMYPYSKPMSR
jgi:hypothetical protein